MAGSHSGGLKAAQTNKRKWGEDFYKVNGSKGGKLGHTGGFYGKPELAREMGKLGGRPKGYSPKKVKVYDTGDDLWPEVFTFKPEPKKHFWEFWK